MNIHKSTESGNHLIVREVGVNSKKKHSIISKYLYKQIVKFTDWMVWWGKKKLILIAVQVHQLPLTIISIKFMVCECIFLLPLLLSQGWKEEKSRAQMLIVINWIICYIFNDLKVQKWRRPILWHKNDGRNCKEQDILTDLLTMELRHFCTEKEKQFEMKKKINKQDTRDQQSLKSQFISF